jgi:hypothetical protein
MGISIHNNGIPVLAIKVDVTAESIPPEMPITNPSDKEEI